MDKIYIRSINKYITMDEFNENSYHLEHAYKFNNRFIRKCIGYRADGSGVFRSIAVLKNVNNGVYQLCIDNDGIIPTLDFVNDFMSGKITEFDSQIFDSIYKTITETSEKLETIIRNN